MKTIIWISGVAAVFGAALAALVADAAVGDVVYIKQLQAVELTAGQKTQLGAIVTEHFPTVSLANAVEFNCFRSLAGRDADAVYCGGAIEETITEDVFADRAVNQAVLNVVSRGGGNVTLQKTGVSDALTTQEKTTVTTFVNDVWSGVAAGTLVRFHCKKYDATVKCHAIAVVTASPADFAVDYEAGLVIKALGRVE